MSTPFIERQQTLKILVKSRGHQDRSATHGQVRSQHDIWKHGVARQHNFVDVSRFTLDDAHAKVTHPIRSLHRHACVPVPLIFILRQNAACISCDRLRPDQTPTTRDQPGSHFIRLEPTHALDDHPPHSGGGEDFTVNARRPQDHQNQEKSDQNEALISIRPK